MKMSLSKFLRWGRKDPQPGADTPQWAKKDMGRAEEAEAAPTGERRRSIRWPKGGTARMSWIADSGSLMTASAWLKDTGDGGLGVYLRKPIETGLTVWVMTHDGDDWQGVTRYCTPAEEGFQVGFERIKSTHEKSDTNVVGTHLKWLEKSGQYAWTPVSVRNAADGRLEVVTSRAVPTPTIAMLTAREVRCLASALACHKRGNRFLVEMEVVSDTYKNPAFAR